MNTRHTTTAALVLALLVPATAFGWGWGKKKEEAKAETPALPALKAGIHHNCLRPLAAKNEPLGLIGMGMLDQTKGDLAAAMEKYKAAVLAEYDVVAAPIDFTLVNGVIWIQSEVCAVPVPAAPEAEAIEEPKFEEELETVYPKPLENVRSEGSVTAAVWVGPDGRAARVHVAESGAGPSGLDRRYVAGEEAAERLVARVQFALQAIEDLRAFDFGKANAGKRFEKKLVYIPKNDISQSGALPGQNGPQTPASVSPIGADTKGNTPGL